MRYVVICTEVDNYIEPTTRSNTMLDTERKLVIEVLHKNNPDNFLSYVFDHTKYTDLVSVQPISGSVGLVYQRLTQLNDGKLSVGPVRQFPIEAVTRQLICSHEADLMKVCVSGITAEIRLALAKEIALECDQEIRKNILENATKLKLVDIGQDITKAAYTIMQNTTYLANRVVVSPKMMVMLLNCPSFNSKTMQFLINDDHHIDIIVDVFNDDVILVVYVGNIDSGLIYAPYKISQETKNGKVHFNYHYNLKVMDNVSNYYVALSEEY
jgi:hypothetical protein